MLATPTVVTMLVLQLVSRVGGCGRRVAVPTPSLGSRKGSGGHGNQASRARDGACRLRLVAAQWRSREGAG